VFPWVAGGFGALIGCVWAGAALAAAVAGRANEITFNAAGQALLHLPGHLADPAKAWPPPARDALPGPVLYWTAQATVLAVFALVGVLGWRLWVRLGADRPRPLGIDPDAGFAGRRDLLRLIVRAPQPNRVTLGHARGRLLACEPQASLAVVGPTGCGKTVGFAIPALLEWKGPVLATSVKADLLDATIDHRRRQGQVWVYDPTAISGHPSDPWNPLAACRTWGGAMRVAAWMAEAAQPRLDTLADGDYWYSQARKGLAPYLHAAALSGKGIGTLVGWIDTQEQKAVEGALRRGPAPPGVDPVTGEVITPEVGGKRWDELWDASVEIARDLLDHLGGELAALSDAPLPDWPEWLLEQVTRAVETEWVLEFAPAELEGGMSALTSARALWGKEARLKGSVFATIENVVAGWADPEVAANASADGTPVDLDKWLAGDNTIYVVATAHEQHRLRPVLTVLVQQAIRAAYDTASRRGGRLEHPCLLLLDEAGNAAPLRDLPGYASTARSHAITLVTVWQDLAQIKATYADRAQTVLNNHRAKLFGAGIADGETLDYISRLVGDHPITERNVSADLGGGGRRSISEHRTYRRAAPVDVVRRIPPGEAVLVYGSELPAHVRLRPWFADRLLEGLALRPDLSHPEGTSRRDRYALLRR